MNRIDELAEQVGLQKIPPVHLWKPQRIGEIAIRIDASGAWFHEGDPILRDKLVRLFASILWYEHDEHYLVTPAEKLKIQVEDVPFIGHQAEFADDTWVVVTNTQEELIIGRDHPVELRDYRKQWVPYVRVRYDLWARVNRRIYVQWANHALDTVQASDQQLTLVSDGYVFRVAQQ